MLGRSCTGELKAEPAMPTAAGRRHYRQGHCRAWLGTTETRSHARQGLARFTQDRTGNAACGRSETLPARPLPSMARHYRNPQPCSAGASPVYPGQNRQCRPRQVRDIAGKAVAEHGSALPEPAAMLGRGFPGLPRTVPAMPTAAGRWHCRQGQCRAWLGTTCRRRGAYLAFSAIQASSFSSSTSSGTEPSFSTSAWNSRMSNLAPSLSCARLRSSWIFSSPVL